MPKILTNREFLQASLKGAKYADGSKPTRYVPPSAPVEPPPPEPEVQVVEKATEIDLSPLIAAIESIQPAMPRPPMTYEFLVTSRDASGKVKTFTVTESAHGE